MPMTTDKRRAFRELHRTGCFVVPNPWDVGSARYLQHLGFKALASTSSGFAWSRACPDRTVTVDMVLAHLRDLCAASDLPVNADFEQGYAHDVGEMAENVRRCVDTGVAGLSIEDASGDTDDPIYPIDEAVTRIRAARAAIDRAGGEVLLTGRAEGFLFGRPDLDDIIRRLRAYAQAGADCLYAPGIRTREQITAVVEAVAPKPVNLLVGGVTDLTVSDIAALGVRRISVGGGLARSAWGGFMRAAQQIASEGTFAAFAQAASGAELNELFGADLARRGRP
ncbi:MAG TPA: isocitrate lyase/phosphoenolpyruvate mutase family protein [Xanthobacteraceae bacterium]|nr:isocitrate lyase/phosphoenolpyruvate mutase family protein [Xanthobacteraceae bacterium]